MNDQPMRDTVIEDRPIERGLPVEMVDAVETDLEQPIALGEPMAEVVVAEPTPEPAMTAEPVAAPVAEGLMERVEHAVVDAIHAAVQGV